MAHVRIGNPEPLDHNTGEPAEGPLVTEMHPGEHMPLADQFLAITHSGGVWAKHSAAHPSWVWSDKPELEALLASHYGCPIGEPEGDVDVAEGRHEAPAAPVPALPSTPAPAAAPEATVQARTAQEN